MIARFGDSMARLAARIVPEPIVLAAVLCLTATALGLWHGEANDVLAGWLSGFQRPALLAFGFQMCLVLVTGHALAESGPARRAIAVVAARPKGPASAAAVVGFVSCLAAVCHWGLGAVLGALLARAIGERARKTNVVVHYPLLGGAAYAGMAVWHGGLSGSAPLAVASEGHFAADAVGVVPASATLFSPLNALITLGLMVLLPLVLAAMAPTSAACAAAPSTEVPAEPADASKHRVLSFALALTGVATIGALAAVGRTSVNLTTVIVAFFCLGLALHGSLTGYAASISRAAKGAGAILLQFPLYFATLGVLRASGLAASMSAKLVELASADTFPIVAFALAGLTNLFVPSGGGQWAVQGPILLGAGQQLGVPAAETVMAFAYGDAWTNMLQPFWALPLLAIMGLKAKDVMGYTAVLFLAMGVFVVAVLALV
ncbi:MAG: TIGR00366 family protein [Myxococcota bacterium]